MSETKFTKGEWVIEVSNYGTLEVVVLDADWQICQFTRSDDASNDANLIASAPEMYAMLEDLAQECQCDCGYKSCRVERIRKDIDDMLTKARGESC
jgi:hypothetical protein